MADYGLRIHFRMGRALKKTLPPETIVVTGRGGGDCGFQFEVGKTYLVYARSLLESQLETDICMRTKLSEGAAHEVVLLGKPAVSR